MKTDYNCKRGFTLIELLVVIAVTTVLLSITVPAYRNAVAIAKKTVCAAQMRQYAFALPQYAHDNDDSFCPYSTLRSKKFPWYKHEHWANFLAKYVGRKDISFDDVKGEYLNLRQKFRYCPTGKAMTGAVYGGISMPGNPAPFVEIGADNPAKKFSKIENPYLLASFMDSFSGAAVYSPSVWPLDTDTDNDGIVDSNYEASVRGIIPYNWSKPKVHNEKCNVIFADGRSDTLKFKEFIEQENPIWGKPFFDNQ